VDLLARLQGRSWDAAIEHRGLLLEGEALDWELGLGDQRGPREWQEGHARASAGRAGGVDQGLAEALPGSSGGSRKGQNSAFQ